MSLYLLIAACVIGACVLLNKVSDKIGIPMLLAFMVLGMLFGSDGILGIEYSDFPVTEKICTVALIFIMFYGGFGTSWKQARPVALKAGLLASIGVLITAGVTGLFCWLVLGMDPRFSFLIGSVLSSTDAASVFSILRSKNLGLKYNTASMLEIESGSNDPCSYMLTAIMITIITADTSAPDIVYMIFAQLVYGAGLGILIAWGFTRLIKHLRYTSSAFDTLMVFALAIFSYAMPSLIGGNGYLSAYIVGIILGNTKFNGKKHLVNFFDGINGLMQVIIFFLLGLLSFPSQMPKVILPAIAIALFMLIVARPISVFAILSPFKCKIRQQALVSFVGLRGAASIVFAIMATPAATQIIGDETGLFNIVFTIVLLSISMQGSLIPWVSRKLNMIDKDEDIMKTFTDYTVDTDIDFFYFDITEEDRWNGKILKNLEIPRDALVALIIRDDRTIIPNGNTRIITGDRVVMTARNFQDDQVIHLSERKIGKGNEWIGRRVFEYSPSPDELIVLIQRGNKTIIPRGSTKVEENDIMVINKVLKNVSKDQ